MRHRRRFVALAAVLAALGAIPATAAVGRAAAHLGTSVHAGGLPGSAFTRLGAAAGHDGLRMAGHDALRVAGPGVPRVAGSGATRVERGEHGDGRGPGGDRGPRRGGARTGGADPVDPFVVVASATAGVGALVALVLSVSRALRRRRG
ncbi:hypothetical protein [Streptomyces rhizosphaerihabitans]|uniref:hypothetical protein n=1 Tax=Streptomyces rhizosphaerihabitans TaxID=1266770 RepID=UPI0021C19C78|nr:hypothetical protein [Streptomyces rhizosphaerihabitans]MCT9004982.1 hypothetical protein [Streptomyces rhizosphaerihabitans]